jgi:hypothetical protein
MPPESEVSGLGSNLAESVELLTSLRGVYAMSEFPKLASHFELANSFLLRNVEKRAFA